MDKTKQQYLTLVFGNLVIFAATCLVTIYTVLSSLRIIVQRLKDISITGNMTMVDRGETLVQGYPISDYLGGIVSMVIALYLTTIVIKISVYISNSEIGKIKKDVQKVEIFLFSIALLCLWSKEDVSDIVPIIYSWICLLLLKETLGMKISEIKLSIKSDSNFDSFLNFDKHWFTEANYFLSREWKKWLIPIRIEINRVAGSVETMNSKEKKMYLSWNISGSYNQGTVKFRLKYTPFSIFLQNDPPKIVKVGKAMSLSPKSNMERIEKE